jgi:simple sugar transport system substrate-binding protein
MKGPLRFFFPLALILACAPSEGRFSHYRVAFLLGGGQDSSFAQQLYLGAREAEELFGMKMDYYWSNWDFEQIVIDFKFALSKKPDAIVIVGHPGDNLLGPSIREAFRSGVLVTSLNVGLPQTQEEFQSQGMGYVGQDVYHSGRDLVEAAIQRYPPPGEDFLAWVIGIRSLGNRGLRSKGLVDALEERGLPYVYHDAGLFFLDPDEIFRYTRDVLSLSKQPPTHLFLDVPTTPVQEAMREGGIGPNEVLGFSFDLLRDNVIALDEGYIHLVQDQQPFLQGFLPPLLACLSLEYGFSGLQINTDGAFIDRTSLDLIRPLVEVGIR